MTDFREPPAWFTQDTIEHLTIEAVTQGIAQGVLAGLNMQHAMLTMLQTLIEQGVIQMADDTVLKADVDALVDAVNSAVANVTGELTDLGSQIATLTAGAVPQADLDALAAKVEAATAALAPLQAVSPPPVADPVADPAPPVDTTDPTAPPVTDPTVPGDPIPVGDTGSDVTTDPTIPVPDPTDAPTA